MWELTSESPYCSACPCSRACARYDQKQAHRRDGTYNAGGFSEGPCLDAGGESYVGGHYAACAQRVDLLGHFRQKSADARCPYQEGNLEAQRRHAPPVLLGRLYSSLKRRPRCIQSLKWLSF